MNRGHDMKCTRLRKLLMPYAEGSLPKAMAESLEHHLAGCESCSRELRSLTCTVDVLKRVEYPVMEPAADLRSRVLAQISPEPARKSWWQATRLQAYSSAAAGLLLVAIAGTAMWSMLQRGIEVPAHQEALRQQKVAKTEWSSGVRDPAEMKSGPQSSKTVGQPEKPVMKMYGPRPAKEAASPLSLIMPGSVGVPYPADTERGLSTDWHSSGGYAGLPTQVEEDPGAPEASSEIPKATGEGMTMADRLAKDRGPSVEAMPGRSQDLMLSTNQADLGGTQTPNHSAESEGIDRGKPAASAGGVLAHPADEMPSSLSVGTDLDSAAKADSRIAAGNSPTFFAETVLGVDIGALETKLRDFPSSITVITNLMVKYREAKRPRDEYQMAQRLTKLDPDNSGYWLSRAQAADRVPMPATARSCYQRAIKLGLKDAELAQAQERIKALEKK